MTPPPDNQGCIYEVIRTISIEGTDTLPVNSKRQKDRCNQFNERMNQLRLGLYEDKKVWSTKSEFHQDTTIALDTDILQEIKAAY